MFKAAILLVLFAFVASVFSQTNDNQANIQQLRRLQELFQRDQVTEENNKRALLELTKWTKNANNELIADYIRVGRTYTTLWHAGMLMGRLTQYHTCILTNANEQPAEGANEANNESNNQCQAESRLVQQAIRKALRFAERQNQRPGRRSDSDMEESEDMEENQPTTRSAGNTNRNRSN